MRRRKRRRNHRRPEPKYYLYPDFPEAWQRDREFVELVRQASEEMEREWGIGLERELLLARGAKVRLIKRARS